MADETHSLSEPVMAVCSVCGTKYSAEIWFIIDGTERPDLIERLAAGELNIVTCPNGHPGTAGFALLLFLPGQDPPLVLSTTERFLSAESRGQGLALLDVLRSSMARWDDSWKALHIERRLLPIALRKGIQAYLQYAEELNRRLRENSPVPEPFFATVAIAQAAQRRYRETGSVAEIDAAIEAWESILQHPDFPASGAWFLPSALDETGSAYLLRYWATKQESDLDRAESLSQRALELSPPDSPTLALVLNNLVVRLETRYKQSGRPEDLNRQIETLGRADRIAGEDSPVKLKILGSLGLALRERYLIKGDLADLRNSAASLERAAEAARRGSILGPEHLTNLGNIQDLLYLRTGDPQAIDAALSNFRQAVALCPEGSPQRPGLLNNLGNGLRDRFTGTRDLADLEEAIGAFREGLTLDPKEDLDRAGLLLNLGSALRDRQIHAQRESDLDEAIEHFRSALALLQEGTRDQALALSNLSTALHDRARRKDGRSPQDLQEAMLASQKAVHQTHAADPERALRLLTLGVIAIESFDSTGEAGELDAGIENLFEARSLGAGSYLGSRVGFNLGTALQKRFSRTGSQADLQAGVAAFLESCEQGLAVGPESSLYSSSNWLDWAIDRADWQEAVEALSFGLRAEDLLLGEQAARDHKESWLRHARGLHAGGAYALARLGDLQRAAVVLEEGRGRLLSEALDREAAEAGRTSFAEIQAAAAPSPLVYLAVTDAGGLALIVSADGTVSPLWLDSLSHNGLGEVIVGGKEVPEELSFLRSQIRWRFDPSPEMERNWLLSLERTTRWLWDALMGPLERALVSRGWERIVLIPQGQLGLLPLHAAWHEVLGETTGRRHVVLDALEISYSPNARALLAARGRAASAGADTICAIENPDGTLPFTEHEVSAALSYFPSEGIRHLRGAAAHPAAVRAAMVGANVLHFATHGEALSLDPLSSSLLLADRRKLPLRDILEIELQEVRLVVLSACETGVPGLAVPDEVISLPTGFLQAGAAGVLGSLWSVDDSSTMLLMVRFYELWREEDLSPSRALREAQIWLRGLTQAEVWSRLRQLSVDEEVGWRGPVRQRSPATGGPFEHPFHWAAFTFTGA